MISIPASNLSIALGLLTNERSGPQNFDLWSGVVDEARAKNIGLISFSRRGFPGQPLANRESIYDIIHPYRIDGLIVPCTLTAFAGGAESTRRFLEQFGSIPIVSYGVVLDDMPGVLVDNYGGVREAMQHLIRDHQYRNIGFLFGEGNPYDLAVRFQAYTDVLVEHGIPVDPDRVVQPHQWISADHAAHLLFDQRKLQLDAIVASSDATALQFMAVLQKRGMRVPDNVALIGFDYSEASQVVTPPLTTIPLRAYERGRRTVRIMLEILAGKTVPNQILVDTKLVVRESCGCVTPALVWAKTGGAVAIDTVPQHATFDTFFETQRWQIEDLIFQSIGSFRVEAAAVQQVLDGFLQELEVGDDSQTTGPFLRTLEMVLQDTHGSGRVLASWQNAISVLRHLVLPYFQSPTSAARVEGLFQQARVLIGEHARRAQAFQGWQAQQQANRLHEMGQRLTTTPELPHIIQLLTDELPHLGIPRCYLAIYDPADPDHTWATLLLAYDQADPREYPPYRFLAHKLVPDDVLGFRRDAMTSLVVEPLNFQDEQLGFVIFELGPQDGRLYEVLAMQLSSALLVSNLVRRNVRFYEEALEAQRRAEQADQLKSRFLAMVSHELRTPLLSLVGLSEMLLHDDLIKKPVSTDEHREDLKRIHYSAKQLDGLIRDVLDLSLSQVGQLKLTKSAVDMYDMLMTVSASGSQMAREKGLQWHVHIPDSLPMVWGDRTRLQQVALNLISNAVKFTAHGEVRLRVEVDHAQAEITLWVSDTGLGIPPEDQAAIFDEFHQSSRTVAQGFSGLGLGLAICQHLVELHEGSIGIHESGETGSTFYVTLPILDHDFDSLETSGQRDTKSVVLLTEDPNPDARLLAGLARDGYHVEIVTSHDQDQTWLADVTALRPDAIVLDYETSSCQGWNLITTLKNDPATQDIPLLFYSLFEDTGSVITLDYVPKPLGTTTLTRALERQGLNDADRSLILVVDDEPGILRANVALVQRHLPHCRVITAMNGYEALEAVQLEYPDLILLDLIMPEMDGFAVLEALQQDDMTRQIPVIVLTAQMLNDESLARLNERVAGILAKGIFNADETIAHIEAALTQSKTLSYDTQWIVRQGMVYIHQHFADPITRQDIADHTGVSEGHLTRSFRQELSITPLTYLNRFRIKQAKTLLGHANTSITEVAAAAGFADSSYFARVFRRETGVSPSEYRRGLRAPEQTR